MVKLTSIPSRVALGSVVEAQCHVTNATERIMMLSLLARASHAPAIIPIGVSAMVRPCHLASAVFRSCAVCAVCAVKFAGSLELR